MHSTTLSNGKTIPSLGFGTWQLENGTAAAAVETALDIGYRHIDCASIYENQKDVGTALTAALQAGKVNRDKLFVTSKLWNTDHAPADVETACRQTLQDLGLEYLDLYLMHWAVAFEQGSNPEPLDENGVAKFSFVPLQDTWHAMEALVEKGLVRSIGVSNFGATLLVDLLGYAKIKPVMNQVELHPYHTQEALVQFCQANGIAVTAYSPLGSSGAAVIQDGVLKEIAAAHHKTAAQIAIRWALQRNTIVIPKSANETRIRENFAVSDFELTPEEMNAIAGLDKKKPLVDPINWWGFPYFQ